MKAMTQHRYGDASALHYADVDRPEPSAGEVLVKVAAAALNHADRVDVHGLPAIARLAFGVRRPRRPIPGRAVAGTVEAVGANVHAWTPGAAVLCETSKGGFAEYATVPANRLAAKPDGVTFEQAATLPVAATTALQAVRLAGLERRPGLSLLVNGASGGVGTFAVQLGRLFGARVTAVCSARNAERALAHGATTVIDYTRENVTRGPERYDAIIDLAGGHPTGAMRRLLRANGVYIASYGAGGRILGPLPRLLPLAASSATHGGRLKLLVARPDPADLVTLAAMVADGRLTPHIERVFPLSATADALHRLETEHARGKTVIAVWSPDA
ncbi:NAD(P)-dependent alcohol dehydrogenase [Dactylosporangium sp. CS-033363]|uniref:NAD(P)-dependent alcohol dehydrogenase n=1 Tax=Dactylosporangium sp. CS-033363 TaxID=3239935 RepID=UPI003D928FC1